MFLAQDWQAAASDIEVVKEMEWLMYSYVTFFYDYCLNAKKTVKYMYIIMNINCWIVHIFLLTFPKDLLTKMYR